MASSTLRKFFGAILWFSLGLSSRAAGYLVYFGTTSERKTSEGIYVAHFDTETGKLSPASLVAKITSPMFINFHPSKPVLYAIGETAEGSKTLGEVDAYAVDPANGALKLINKQHTGGDALCYVLPDATGQAALAASYRDGTVMSFPLHRDGSLGERVSLVRHVGSSVHPRQTSPHTHCIDLDPSNRFALVADLGTDHVVTYKFDPATATISQQQEPLKTKSGAGPRHLAFDQAGRHVYVVDEIDNTIITADYDSKTGRLTQKQVLPLLPADFKGESTAAEVVIHPSGRFLYASNRGYDSLALFTIDPPTGLLTFVSYTYEGVKHPRHFAIDPTGRWLLCGNRDADTITVYRIDVKTGRLQPTGTPTSVPMPTCVKFYRP